MNSNIVNTVFIVAGMATGLSCFNLFLKQGVTPQTIAVGLLFLGCLLVGLFRAPSKVKTNSEMSQSTAWTKPLDSMSSE